MGSRATLHDIAHAAGVSSATVDRVLNQRDGVRPRTREVVLAAAQKLGYVADAPPVPTVDLVFLLPAGTNAFIKLLAQQITAQAASRPGLTARIETLEGFNPQTVAARLTALQGQCQGLALIAQDHPLVREAIRGLVQSGTPVATLASDIQNTPRLAYVGIDNRQAGRLAGLLMARLLGKGRQKVALFAGSLSYRGHEEREMGFRHILRDDYPMVEIVELREILDDREKAFAEAERLLAAHPDLSGIYNVGGGTQGIAQALKTAGRDQSVVLIGHDLTENNKQRLLDGTLDAVLDQNPRVEAREVLNLLTAAALGQPYSHIPTRLQVIFRENLPSE